MLFPFICFNDNHERPTTCPETLHIRGLLYKYNICINLNLSKVKNHIITRITELKPNDICRWKNEITGLGSVLPRITNLLYFIIGIHSDKITDLNLYIDQYRPNCREAFNFNNIGNEPNIIDDDFRGELLTFFNFMIKNFNKFTKLKVDTVDLASRFISNITMANFNKLSDINICGSFESEPKIDTSTNINYSRIENTANYYLISKNFLTVCKKISHKYRMIKNQLLQI
jgi:hypothetical protein